MKTVTERIKQRMRKERKMTSISIRIPEDLIDDLKEMAPLLGFSGYQSLIRSYVGEGLRRDEARFGNSQIQALTESLRRQGIDDQVISTVLAEAQLTSV